MRLLNGFDGNSNCLRQMLDGGYWETFQVTRAEFRIGYKKEAAYGF